MVQKIAYLESQVLFKDSNIVDEQPRCMYQDKNGNYRKNDHKHADYVLAELFSFFCLRFSLIVSFAFFLVSLLPLSLFPLSPIFTPPH